MIDTLCTGSVFGSACATSACPPSWYAMTRFSCVGDEPAAPLGPRHHPVDRLFELGHADEAQLRAGAASNAASFSRLARSAPVKPGVRRAITSRSTPSASGLPRACTRRMALRPSRSGRSTTI